MTDSSSAAEHSIRAAFDAADFASAARIALETYGDEVLGFLDARLRNPSDGHEVFSMLVEDMWRGLPRFGWRCSMRTWLYVLARNAASRYLLSPQRVVALPLGSGLDQLSGLIDRIRSATDVYQRTDVKDRFRQLCDALDQEDRMLLVLRVDRGLSWRELALALAGDPDLNDAAVDREAARLRKAFERLKGELRHRAEADGLLAPRGER